MDLAAKMQAKEVTHADSAGSVQCFRFTEPTSIRLRFFNFNMANMAALDPFVGMLGQFLSKPFADASKVDVTFVALTEARFKMRDFVKDQLGTWRHNMPESGMDTLLHRDALKKNPTATWNPFTWCRKKVVQHCVGNVKTVLGFRKEAFKKEERDDQLFGTFTFNPEKAFLGTSIVRDDGLRLCFFGTHFPMQRLQSVLVSNKINDSEKLMAAKIEYARVLREVLCRAAAWNFSHNTVIFVQGDLNSRTVFDHHEIGSQAKDVLLEVLKDTALMAAMTSDLQLPKGRWHEVVPFNGVNEMPVTYKVDPKMCIQRQVTVGDILNRVHDPAQPPPGAKRTLTSVHRNEFGNEWGLKKDPAKVKASHFPAFTERVIYWAPDALSSQMSWALPHGGYETLGHIDGSDHRPVTLEALMVLGPQHSLPPMPSREDPEVKELANRLVSKRWLDKLLCYSETSIDGSDMELKTSSSDESLRAVV